MSYNLGNDQIFTRPTCCISSVLSVHSNWNTAFIFVYWSLNRMFKNTKAYRIVCVKKITIHHYAVNKNPCLAHFVSLQFAILEPHFYATMCFPKYYKCNIIIYHQQYKKTLWGSRCKMYTKTRSFCRLYITTLLSDFTFGSFQFDCKNIYTWSLRKQK